MEKYTKRKILSALALSFMLLFLGAERLSAHTSLLDSSPERGKSVSGLQEIELTFAGGLINDGKAKITLTTIRDGKEIPIGETIFVSDFILRADVPTDLKPGQYVVRYRVTSLDGDLNDGGYSFELLASKGNDAIWIVLAVGIFTIAAVLAVLKKNPKKEKE